MLERFENKNILLFKGTGSYWSLRFVVTCTLWKRQFDKKKMNWKINNKSLKTYSKNKIQPNTRADPNLTFGLFSGFTWDLLWICCLKICVHLGLLWVSSGFILGLLGICFCGPLYALNYGADLSFILPSNCL